MHCDRKNRDNFNRPFIINEVLDELEISEDIYWTAESQLKNEV